LNTHEQYEELCALAASGQASEEQLSDLRLHLEDCPSCRTAAYDFRQISAQGLAQVAAKRVDCEIPTGMTQRFIARARSEGIEMSRETASSAKRPRRVRLLAAFAAVAAAALITGLLVIESRKPSSIASSEHNSITSSPLVTKPIAASQDLNGNTRLQQELEAAQSKIGSLEGTIQRQQRELDDMRRLQEGLSSEIAEAQNAMSNAHSEDDHLKVRIASLEAELAKSQADKNAGDVVLATQEMELSNLRKKLTDQESALNAQEELAARGKDVRDLVVARNLHIIDVHDRDGDGKNQRAFGRIFYTEGESFIFYAYDLGDPRKIDAKVSFYVWGGRLGAEKPIRSLGVFHNDDANEGRWVLTFDDPQVLAQIDSVFVTVESAKKSIKEPGGRRILFAFLGDKPNHP
jgi:hypothetical protein